MNDRTREILDLIACDERRLRVGQRLPSEGPIAWETIKLVREDLAAGGGPRGKPLHSVDEIKALYESDKVRLTADGRALLTRIANLPGLGGLRMCGKLVQVATLASGGELIDAKLLLRVIRTMNDQAFAVNTVEAAIQREAQRAIA